MAQRDHDRFADRTVRSGTSAPHKMSHLDPLPQLRRLSWLWCRGCMGSLLGLITDSQIHNAKQTFQLLLELSRLQVRNEVASP